MNQMGNDQRIETDVQRGKEIEIFIDNHPIRAYEGETIAGVLSAIGIRQIRHAPQLKDPRGLYCCMGSCYGCLVTVNGRPNERACVTPVQAGQHISLQVGFGRADMTSLDPARLVRREIPLVIIGGGPGGYAAALYAHNFGLSVALVEKERVGGTCLLRGCIPAKSWLQAAEVYQTVKTSSEFGVTGADDPGFD